MYTATDEIPDLGDLFWKKIFWKVTSFPESCRRTDIFVHRPVVKNVFATFQMSSKFAGQNLAIPALGQHCDA